MLFALYAALPEVHIHLPDVLRGMYPREVDPVLPKALLVTSMTYRRDVIKAKLTKDELLWVDREFDYLGIAQPKPVKNPDTSEGAPPMLISDLHDVIRIQFKLKNGPAGTVFPPPTQSDYDLEQFVPYTLDRLDRARYLYTLPIDSASNLMQNGYLRPLGECIHSYSKKRYDDYLVPGRHTSNVFYAIGCGIGASTALAAAKKYQAYGLDNIDFVNYFCGGDFVLKDNQWRNIQEPYPIGECNVWDFKAPEMVDPWPLYDRNPWWLFKALGYRYPKYKKTLVLTGHHNGPNKLGIPDTYCPYFKSAIHRPWIIPWGVLPPCKPFGPHMHKGWFRRR